MLLLIPVLPGQYFNQPHNCKVNFEKQERQVSEDTPTGDIRCNLKSSFYFKSASL